MTALLDMRDRIAAAAQIELRSRGLADAVGVALAIADRALADVQFEALTGYVGAVEAGTDPAVARGRLAADPILSDFLTVIP